MAQLQHPRTARLLEVMPDPPAALPGWLSEKALEYHVEQFRTSGFRGGINWYRNMPTNDGLTPELKDKRFAMPAAFAAGASDAVLLFDPNWRDSFTKAFDDLRFLEIVEGAGHWIQLEKPKETTELLLRFLGGL